MKKKVLIIPSWYPSKNSEVGGSFFREQATLMSADFEMAVLLDKPHHVSRNYYYHNFLAKIRGIDLNKIELSAYEIQPPTAWQFEHLYYTSFTKEEQNQMLINYYIKAVEILIKEKNWKPDMLHAQSAIKGGWIAHELSKKFNIPYMITEHFGPFLLYDYTKDIQNRIKASIESAHVMAAVSHDKARTMLMHGYDCEPIVVGNLVDENIFKIPEKNKQENTFNILIVAYSHFIKDIKTFFRVIQKIVQEGHTDIKAKIISADKYSDKIMAMIKDLDLTSYIDFLEAVPRQEMPKYFAQADVFVMTSIAEGLPVSILEAMACGLPVVSTANGGFEDIVQPFNGVMTPVRDVEGIASAIIKIKNKDITFDAEQIRNHIIQKFGTEAFKKRIKTLYLETIAKATQTH